MVNCKFFKILQFFEKDTQNRAKYRLQEVVTYGEGEKNEVNEQSLTPPVREFVRQFIASGMSPNWLMDCINTPELCAPAVEGICSNNCI